MTESGKDILSDLERSDAYVLTAADYDEIPEITDEDWERAVFSDGGAASDRAVAASGADLRLDADVAAGLRDSGEGWETRANETLREWLRARAA